MKRTRHFVTALDASFLTIAMSVMTMGLTFFVPPIIRELGFATGQFMIYYSCYNFACMLLSPIWGKALLPRLGTRRSILIGGIGVVLGFVLFSRCRSLPAFYCTAILLGICAPGCMYLPQSILVNNWFSKNRGLVMGLVMGSSGLGGILWGQLLPMLIQNNGWRNTFLLLAAIMGVLLLPTSFFLHTKPEEIGMRPYGADQAAASRPAFIAAIGLLALTLIALLSGLAKSRKLWEKQAERE